MRALVPLLLCLGVSVRAQSVLDLTAETARLVSLSGLATASGDFAATGDARFVQGWTSRFDYPSWTLQVLRPGRVRVAVVLSNGDGAGGAEFAVRIGASELTGTVPSTGGWRGRKAFRVLDLGEMELPAAGPLRAEIIPLRVPRLSVMGLKDLLLLGTGPAPAELAAGESAAPAWADTPGFGKPTGGLHPGLAAPEDLTPPGSPRLRVTGLDRMPDGRFAVATWDAVGSVYLVDASKTPEEGRFHLFATGLAEPTGLKVVEGAVHVLERQRLTRLEDRDGDGLCEAQVCVSQAWPVSSHPDENAFGPLWREGRFLVATGVAMTPVGVTKNPQVRDRGCVLSIKPADGSYEVLAAGNRSQNGLVLNDAGDMFLMDNQGDWMPCSSLFHVTPGAFFGHRYDPPHPLASRPVKGPALRLPHVELSVSPTQPVFLHDGPFRGQMVFGDISFSGLLRASLEQVDGVWQGVALRFSSGLQAPANRLLEGPAGAILAGELAMPTLPASGRRDHGLERVAWSGRPFFDLRTSRLMSDGFELELTEPLAAGLGWDPAAYQVTQWTYLPTAEYGGPKLEEESLAVEAAAISPDRLRISLAVKGVREGRVVRVALAPGHFVSEGGRALWTGDAYHTVNRLPRALPVPRAVPPAGSRMFSRPGTGLAVSPGESLFRSLCASCHSPDGTPMVGPTFHNLFGKRHFVTTGGVRHEILVDEAFVKRSILQPGADIAEGFQPLMPELASRLSAGQVDSLVGFVRSCSPAGGLSRNLLTEKDKREGWVSLFDGTSRRGWGPALPGRAAMGWTIRGEALTWAGNAAGELATETALGDGELEFEWKISVGGIAAVGFAGGSHPDLLLSDNPATCGIFRGQPASAASPKTEPLVWQRANLVRLGGRTEVRINGVKTAEWSGQDVGKQPFVLRDESHPVWFRGLRFRAR